MGTLEPFKRVWSDFQDCKNRPCSKPWAIAQGFCSKSAKLPLLRIQPKSTQRVAKAVKNPIRGLWNRFREFGAISRTCQNRPCSKPWAFCSKSAKFRLFRIHPISTQRVTKAVKNPFTRALEPFQRVWSDFQDLPKSAMFKTMGYSPRFLLKIGQISTLPNSP